MKTWAQKVKMINLQFLFEGVNFCKAPDLSEKKNFKCLYLKMLKMDMVTSSHALLNEITQNDTTELDLML